MRNADWLLPGAVVLALAVLAWGLLVWSQAIPFDEADWDVVRIGYNETSPVNVTWQELDDAGLASPFRKSTEPGGRVDISEKRAQQLEAFLSSRARPGQDWRKVSVEGVQYVIVASRS